MAIHFITDHVDFANATLLIDEVGHHARKLRTDDSAQLHGANEIVGGERRVAGVELELDAAARRRPRRLRALLAVVVGHDPSLYDGAIVGERTLRTLRHSPRLTRGRTER